MKKLLFMVFFYFVPSLAVPQNTRFMVSSDTHIYSPESNFQETMLYELALAAIDEQVDFIFFTGDLVVRGFSDPVREDSVLKDWRFVLDTLDYHGIKVLACRGNNDVSSKAAWDSLFKGKYAFPQNGPQNEKNITYAFEMNNILFLSLDQYTEYHRINQNWLDTILNQNKKAHIFFAGHEPAFKLLHSNCMGAYPAERDSLWESMTSAGAKIFFCGHDHFYDHTIIDDGDGNHNNDIHQIIVGTGGGSFHSDSEYNGNNGRWTPVRLFHEHANGYVLVEVTDTDVQMTWKHRTDPGIFVEGGDSYTFVATAIDREEKAISNFVLFQNYPNPFNPKTTISYQLPMQSFVELTIYNITEQKVTTLISKQQPAGNYKLEWDAVQLASGVYIYRLHTDKFTASRKLLLLR